MISDIPVLNIYYLLSYSWNRLNASEQRKIAGSDYKQSLDLLARIFLNATIVLLKGGIEKHYIEVGDEYAGIKGKLDFGQSLKKNLFNKGKSQCTFDELSEDILSNQLLKAALKRLLGTYHLDKQLRAEVKATHLKFQGVSEIGSTANQFSRVRIHQNNARYGFALQVGRLIMEQTALEESIGQYVFQDFQRDHRQMSQLFESFVRNFYTKEQQIFKVLREDIDWQIDESVSTGDLSLIPKMQTDISLRSSTRKIIIDTKFYGAALNSHFETEKFHSMHLYQLYSYLRNQEDCYQNQVPRIYTEGILLYPKNGKSLDEQYVMGNHKMRIATIDLQQPWKTIHERLMVLIT